MDSNPHFVLNVFLIKINMLLTQDTYCLDHLDQACPEYKDTVKLGIFIVHAESNTTLTYVDLSIHPCAFSSDVDLWTCTVVVTVLRVILVKTVIFNTLMTIYIITRW